MTTIQAVDWTIKKPLYIYDAVKRDLESKTKESLEKLDCDVLIKTWQTLLK